MKTIRTLERGKKPQETAILALCGALIATSLLTGFGFPQKVSSGGALGFPGLSAAAEDIVPQMIRRRADIIQLVWYSEITPAEGEKMLAEIETHPLLAADVEWLRKAEDGMGFAYVLDMEVLSLRKTSRSLKGTCYEAEIRWDLEEYNRHVSQRAKYRIRTVTDNDGTVKLAEFTALEVPESQ